ncbi:MAG: hypothetical protein M3M96_08430 [Candidatus Eremiobacteraeota bacterium]|nr:hypothetical protein [Candidatus Eremiobacteraeota bacterium]
MTIQQVHYGPRLVAHPTGALQSAILVAPGPSIEDVSPLQGEPSAKYERAAAQHAILTRTLEYFGVETHVLQVANGDPLACAVADTAIGFESGMIVMRPFAMSRRREAEWIEGECARLDLPIGAHIVSPGLLDGGDVLLAGDAVFVGVSERNNALGRSAFAQVARAYGMRTFEVAVAGRASLRSVASAISGDTVVVAPQFVDPGIFRDAGFRTIVLEHTEEQQGAGVLALGDRHVIADLRYPNAVGQLRKSGVTVEAIDLYDFGKVGLVPANLVLATKRL